MYRVKQDGGNSFGFYSPESSVVWTRDRLAFEKELRAALNKDLLHVLYQPIVDVSQRRIVRMEALIRWQHPTRGFLSPSDFIPLAEDIGLIEQLGAFVLQTACFDAREIALTGYPINVSVNVNPRQLLSSHFVDTVSKVLRETELPASALILEITESAIFSDMAYAAEILNQIKALGVSIALDDFGTGYSSLNYLKRLPIDILKIDRSFARDIVSDTDSSAIVIAIISLARNLGLYALAEGVETKDQFEFLYQEECDRAQGYLFSKPVCAKHFYFLLEQRKTGTLA